MKQLRRWKRLWQRLLTHSHKRISMGPSKSCWNGTTIALQPEEITSKGTRVSCVYYQLKCPYKKSLETYLMILIYIYYMIVNVTLSFMLYTFIRQWTRKFSFEQTDPTANITIMNTHTHAHIYIYIYMHTQRIGQVKSPLLLVSCKLDREKSIWAPNRSKNSRVSWSQ